MFDSEQTARILRRATGIATVAVAGMFLAAQPAAAQQGAPPAQQEIEVSGEELETFAHAFLDVQEIRQEMDSAIQDAEDTQEAQELQQQANQEMAALIEEEYDLTPQRYSQITQAINTDPELQADFQEIVDGLTEDEEDPGA